MWQGCSLKKILKMKKINRRKKIKKDKKRCNLFMIKLRLKQQKDTELRVLDIKDILIWQLKC